MTSNPEFIAAVIGLILAITMLVKVYTDILKIKADRLRTKEERNKDSLELHDQVLKNTFEISRLKDNQALTATVVDDLRDQCATLNTNIVKLDTNIANLTEVVKELKNDN